MKNTNTNQNIQIRLLLLLAFSFGCLEEDKGIEGGLLPPVADFSYETDTDDYFTINFTNFSLNAGSYTWDFGNGATSNEEEPSHTFSVSGIHQVTLVVETSDGRTDQITKPVEVTSPGGVPTGPNIIQGGEMDDEDAWTIGNNSESDPLMNYAFGTSSLQWSANEVGQQIHVWQAVELEAGKNYLVKMNVSGPSLTNGYFQLTIGADQPDPHTDYNYDWTPNEGDECPESLSGIDCNHSKVIGLNYWKGCPTESFDGNIIDFACDGPAQKRDPDNPDDTNTSGVISVPESGTYYFVMKGGWWGGSSDVYEINIDFVFLAPIAE